MATEYIIGDATRPFMNAGNNIIAHICNDVGAWGRGFVVALSERWETPEEAYRRWKKANKMFRLGQTQIVQVETNLYVCNMIAQQGIKWVDGVPPIRYDALEQCLISLEERAKERDAAIHMPRIGCGLAGGDWKTVSELIEKYVKSDVYVYDLS